MPDAGQPIHSLVFFRLRVGSITCQVGKSCNVLVHQFRFGPIFRVCCFIVPPSGLSKPPTLRRGLQGSSSVTVTGKKSRPMSLVLLIMWLTNVWDTKTINHPNFPSPFHFPQISAHAGVMDVTAYARSWQGHPHRVDAPSGLPSWVR